jgi:hypothetical protein
MGPPASSRFLAPLAVPAFVVLLGACHSNVVESPAYPTKNDHHRVSLLVQKEDAVEAACGGSREERTSRDTQARRERERGGDKAGAVDCASLVEERTQDSSATSALIIPSLPLYFGTIFICMVIDLGNPYSYMCGTIAGRQEQYAAVRVFHREAGEVKIGDTVAESGRHRGRDDD